MLGKIYKIEGGSKFYIGSTIQDITKRFKNHKSKSKENKRSNTPLYKHFNEIGWENATIYVIEELNIINKIELLEKENEIIKCHLNDPSCLNSNLVKITKEEKKEKDKKYAKFRRQENPTRERERLNKWRENNPEKRKEQTKRYREKEILR